MLKLLPPSIEDRYPVKDGFLYMTDLRCNLTFLSLAIEQYEALRRSRFYRQKQWCVPRDGESTVIPARGSYEYQLEVGAGAAIWAYRFVGRVDSFDDNGYGTQAWQVRDACNDVALFSEVMTRQTAILEPFDEHPQQLLTKLLVVGAPGLLNVEITNMFTTDRHSQLILYGGVPADR